jgi:hypothetical protein
MLVRQKDVPQRHQRNTCEDQLTGHAVATVDYVCRFVDKDYLRGR